MEAVWFKSDCHRSGLTGELPVVVCLSFRRRNVPDGFKQPVVVEPGHPFEGRKFQRFLGFSRCPTMDQLGLVQAVDGLCQGVVVTVTMATHRGLNACLDQPLGVANADILSPPVGMMGQ